MKIPASAPPPSVAAQCQGSRGTGSLPPRVKQISYINQQQQQQQQFSQIKKQLVESMADVRPSEYLGFHSFESIILA